MAYTFPLPLNGFFRDFPIQSVSFDLGESLEIDQTGGGEILTADVGPRIWRMDVNFRTGEYAKIEGLKAKLNLLRYAERSLFIHAIPSAFPQSDPNGVALNGYIPKLSNVDANNRELFLYDLPPGFVLNPGDCLSFVSGTSPNQRYNFHQIVNRVESDSNGEAWFVEVVPFIEPGWAAEAEVALIRPYLKAVYVPGSFNAGTTGQTKTSGVKASFMQTYGR